jgi:sugar diacid utilization regulator
VPSADGATAAPVVHETAERLTAECQGVHGREFAAGLALSESVAGGGPALAEAMSVVDLLARTGLPQRTAFLEEVVVEALLADHQDLRKRLTDWVAGLSDRPELRDTLRALYCGGLDRGRTARRLGIHRSTLDHRLGRVERLTAVSPTSPRGVVLFSAALAAWRLEGDISDDHVSSGGVVRHSLDAAPVDPAFS